MQPPTQNADGKNDTKEGFDAKVVTGKVLPYKSGNFWPLMSNVAITKYVFGLRIVAGESFCIGY